MKKPCSDCFGKGIKIYTSVDSYGNEHRRTTLRCDTCKGKGTINMSDDIEKSIEEEMKDQLKPGRHMEHPCTKPPFEAVKPVSSAYSTQVGGSHYKDMAIQPGKYCQANRLPFYESNVIKMVSRHRNKGGKQDIEKAIHYLQLLLEEEYSDSED